MPKQKYTTRETLATLSRRWCELNELPQGFYLTLINLADSDRQVRSDMVVHRQVIPGKSKDKELLSSALSKLEQCIITPIGERRLKLVIRTPSKSTINGHTHMATIRALKFSDVFCEAQLEDDARLAEIEQAKDQTLGNFGNLIYGDCFTPLNVARGALQAMRLEFEKATLVAALEAEGFLEGI